MTTIYALSSGRPPAAIAVIRVSGPAAHQAAKRMCGELPEARTAAVRTLRHPLSGDVLDDALVLRFNAPASATGEDVVELHCHGGRAVVDAVLAGLGATDDLEEAQPGEFTRRAFENGRIDLTQAEGLADLLEAETESQRKAALALAEGGLRKQIGDWQEQLLLLSAGAERAIDYDEEDGDAFVPQLNGGCSALAEELRSWLDRPRIEPLKSGIRVVFAGPTNVGKSSLLNAIAGEERAIVSDVEGTTRDHIEVPLSLGGVPLVLTDTAGLRQSADPIEAMGVSRSEALIERAEVLVWLGEAGDCPLHKRTILVQTKADLGRPARSGALAVSSLTSEGLPVLLLTIEQAARALLPAEDDLALNRRQAQEMESAASALEHAAAATDPVIVAEELRGARLAFDRLTGCSGIEDVLDALFSRFCLGK